MLKLSVQEARSGEPSVGPLVFASEWTWIRSAVNQISVLNAPANSVPEHPACSLTQKKLVTHSNHTVGWLLGKADN